MFSMPQRKALGERSRGRAELDKRQLDKRQDELFTRISAIVEAARGAVVRSVNTAMVHAYWFIGREIVVNEQQGLRRADYGEKILVRLSRRLRREHGAGYSLATLKRSRRFYLLYPTGSALPAAETASQ